MNNAFGIDRLIEGIGKVGDDLLTSEEERSRIALKERIVESRLARSQADDRASQRGARIFVAGWRPFIGWIGALTLAYQFILHPLLTWGWMFFQAKGWLAGDLQPPPVLAVRELWVILVGTLGVAALRSFDKLKGTETTQLGNARHGMPTE